MTYTYRNGKKLDLDIDDKQIVVRQSSEQITASGHSVTKRLSSASFAVPTATEDRERVISSLQTNGPVYPYYVRRDDGAPFLITDRLIVTVTNINALIVLQNQFGLEVVSKFSETEYVVRLTTDSDSDPIRIVVRLNEAMPEGVISVDHDLNYLVQISQPSEVHSLAPLHRSDTDYIRQWHLHSLSQDTDFDPRSSSNCEEAWALLGSYGSSDIVIGVTDDGCRLDHPDFDDGKFVGWGYMDGSRLVTHRDIDACPDKMYQHGSNHGTACCGVIAAEVDAALTVGAAPGCSLLPIKWETRSDGSLFISDTKLMDVLCYVEDKVDILSNSWGSVLPTINWPATVVKKIDKLSRDGGRRKKGILFIWAAGNYNRPVNYRAKVGVPYTDGWSKYKDFKGQWRFTWAGVKTASVFENNLVALPGVMHVAALSSRAQRSHYSNYGPGVDICAPSDNGHAYRRLQVRGLGITTTSGEGNKVINQFGGTSSAAPLVAGVAGLVLSGNADLSAFEVIDILRRTASKDLDLTGYARTPPASYDQDTSWDISPIAPFDSGDFDDDGWSPWFGHGRVDAAAAVRAVLDGEPVPSSDDLPDREGQTMVCKVRLAVSQFDDGLDILGAVATDDPILFPTNGDSLECEITLTYFDGTPAPGQRVTASSVPVTLTSPSWRDINALSSRWPSQSGAVLRQRHSQGLVRLQATFDQTTAISDALGRAKFTARAWHVCGNDQQPATDELSFKSPAGTEVIRVKCGVVGLVRITNDAALGVVTKSGISGAFIHPQINQILKTIGSAWKGVLGKSQDMPNHIMVTDGSLRWGGLIPPHLSHRFGGAVDVRPISSDGRRTSVGAENYSREGTRIIIDFMRQTGASRIIFWEKLPGVTDVRPDHADHIHVSWMQNPLEPWSILSQSINNIIEVSSLAD